MFQRRHSRSLHASTKSPARRPPDWKATLTQQSDAWEKQRDSNLKHSMPRHTCQCIFCGVRLVAVLLEHLCRFSLGHVAHPDVESAAAGIRKQNCFLGLTIMRRDMCRCIVARVTRHVLRRGGETSPYLRGAAANTARQSTSAHRPPLALRGMSRSRMGYWVGLFAYFFFCSLARTRRSTSRNMLESFTPSSWYMTGFQPSTSDREAPHTARTAQGLLHSHSLPGFVTATHDGRMPLLLPVLKAVLDGCHGLAVNNFALLALAAHRAS